MFSIKIPIVGSVIDEVTVYRENALVSRKVLIEPELKNSIKVCGLPLSLDDSSIRIRIDSPDNTLKASDFSIILEASKPDLELPLPLDAELNELRHEKNKYELQIQLLDKSLGRISSIPFHPRAVPKDTQVPDVAPIASRKSILDFMVKRKQEILEKRIHLLNKQDEINKKLLDLEEKNILISNSRQNRENELRKSIIIKLDNTGNNEDTKILFLDYLVPGARWYPVYGLNVSRDYSSYTLKMRAMLKQGTGEDWNNVRIKLSTAEVVRWMELPCLSAKIFGRPVTLPQVTGWRKAPEGASVLYSDYDRFIEKKISENEDIYPKINLDSDEGEYDREEINFGENQESEEIYDETFKKEMPVMSSASGVTGSKISKKMRSSASRMMPPEISLTEDMTRIGESSDTTLKPNTFMADTNLLEYNKMRLEGVISDFRGDLKKASIHEQYNISADTALRVENIISDVISSNFGTTPQNCIEPSSYDGFDYSFIMESRVDIPSDGNYHTRLLSFNESDGEMTYISVPRESRDVYRYIQFQNPLKAPVLAGPVDLSIDSVYLLSSNLETVPPGGTIRLGAGVEQAIKVSRNTYYKEESSGVLKGVLGLNHQIDIDVENNLKVAVNMEIRERISVPSVDKVDSADKIKVEIKKVNPVWEELIQEPYYIDGAYRWKAGIDAGVKKQFSVKYEIQIPSQYQLVGGNRREN
jgi:Domain of unknown function (DUF4139)/N-terminal domain of unknown function (DUF4140)